MSKTEIFRDLHHQDELLLIGNVWNVHSAQLFEKLGFKAIATSSAAIAYSFGRADGENISFSELLFIVERISASVNIPFSVDIEGGYGNQISDILTNIEKLADSGVAGINIEDSHINTVREIISADAFSLKLDKIKNHLTKKNINLFINVRTDPFLLNLPAALEETLNRIPVYEKSGADGIFVPCIIEKNDIKEVLAATDLPVNVLSMPGLPSFKELSGLGIKRISMGDFAYNKLMENFEGIINAIIKDQSFESLFKKSEATH